MSDDLTLEKMRIVDKLEKASERLTAVEVILKSNQENLISILQHHAGDIKDLKHTVYGYEENEGLRETVRGISKRETQRSAYVHTGVLTALGLALERAWHVIFK